jgi:hypothetical protein
MVFLYTFKVKASIYLLMIDTTQRVTGKDLQSIKNALSADIGYIEI